MWNTDKSRPRSSWSCRCRCRRQHTKYLGDPIRHDPAYFRKAHNNGIQLSQRRQKTILQELSGTFWYDILGRPLLTSIELLKWPVGIYRGISPFVLNLVRLEIIRLRRFRDICYDLKCQRLCWSHITECSVRTAPRRSSCKYPTFIAASSTALLLIWWISSRLKLSLRQMWSRGSQSVYFTALLHFSSLNYN